MTEPVVRRRPDPYAEENTVLRRQRGVAAGVYQGLTILALTGLVLALHYVDLFASTIAQDVIAAATMIVVGLFTVAMVRRKSRAVESPRARRLIGAWLIATVVSWGTMALMLVLPPQWTWEWGFRAAVRIGLFALALTILGIIVFTAVYGRDWASRRRRNGMTSAPA